MLFRRPQVIGIVNITQDSFSDGGKYLQAEAAIAHAQDLLKQGADIVELGAASSHPDSAKVTPEVEITRLDPVLAHLQSSDTTVAIDTTQRAVQRYALKNRVSYLNDIRGFPDATMDAELTRSDTKLIVMHSISESERAIRKHMSTRDVFASIKRFFEERLTRLMRSGISESRIILDPGMGYFLGSNPEPSLAVLANLARLRELFGHPIMISVSRKSFLRNLAADQGDINSRTLAAELFACTQHIDYIRTHDVGPLHQALLALEATERYIDAGDPFRNS